jgi:hypothetical protein
MDSELTPKRLKTMLHSREVVVARFMDYSK